ncbi:MAG TPA: universal stress protein, partial [Blastococcus sp.]|nr:universal stress protein [Blastococcus sp.]
GGLRSALLGSVALHCTSHAPAPVLVVHPAPADGTVEPRIVVGVDGSAESRAALAAALDEASRSGAGVEVVAAYDVADYWTDLSTVVVPPPDEGRKQVRRQTEALVEEALASRPGPAPSVRVHVVDGPAGYALVHRASGAQLLVVGSRGHGALSGLLLGSVALHCAMHAQAPVLVVRPSRTAAVADAAREPAPAQG